MATEYPQGFVPPTQSKKQFSSQGISANIFCSSSGQSFATTYVGGCPQKAIIRPTFAFALAYKLLKIYSKLCHLPFTCTFKATTYQIIKLCLNYLLQKISFQYYSHEIILKTNLKLVLKCLLNLMQKTF